MRCRTTKRQGLSTYDELHGGRPAELLLDQGIVGVAAAHALWTSNVLDLQVLALDAHHSRSHVVHAHALIASNVHGLPEVGLGEPAGKRQCMHPNEGPTVNRYTRKLIQLQAEGEGTSTSVR